MSAFPSQPEQNFANQPPLRLNEGFVPQQVPQVEEADILDNDELISKMAMDGRGSRQIAPYATYDVVQQALENGYYTGLEALDFGTLPDGTPAALFTDKNGVRQAVRMSESRWFAALQQRADARVAMAKKMRNQRDADKLRPAIQNMTRELEQYAPGFGQYAELGMSENAGQTYQMVQEMYGRLKSADMEEQRLAAKELQKVVDDHDIKMRRGMTENWVKTESDKLDMAMSGALNDESLPEIERAELAQQIQADKFRLQQFAMYNPANAPVARSVSFPSYFFSKGNTRALEDLADMSISSIGSPALAKMSLQQRTAMLIQRAQTIAQNVGWTSRFNETDINIVAQVIQNRLMSQPSLGIMVPAYQMEQSPYQRQMTGGLVRGMREAASEEAQVAESRSLERQQKAAQTARTVADAAAATERARRMREMTPAEIAALEARTGYQEQRTESLRQETPARVRSEKASAAEKEARTRILGGGGPETAPATTKEIDLVPMRKRLEDAGFRIPDTGNFDQDFRALVDEVARTDPRRLDELERLLTEQ